MEVVGAGEAIGRNARRKAAISVNRVLTGRIPRATTGTVGASFLINHLSGLGGATGWKRPDQDSRWKPGKQLSRHGHRAATAASGPHGRQLHFRPGRRGPAVPGTVVLDGDSTLVYALEVSPLLTSELTAAWAAWGKASPADGTHPAESVAIGVGLMSILLATTMYVATMQVAITVPACDRENVAACNIYSSQALSGQIVTGRRKIFQNIAPA